MLALLAFAGALLLLATGWAVRRGHLAPFGWWPRTVRRASDPLIRPFERRLLSAGANPQDAPLWFTGAVMIGGLLAITGVRWILNTGALLAGMRGAGVSSWLLLVLSAATSVVMAAILARLIGSWLGMGRYSRWMKPAYLLSDWLVEPLRRRLPPMGPLDLSPFVAYLILLLVRSLLPDLLR